MTTLGHRLPELKVPSSNIAFEQFPRGLLNPGMGADDQGQTHCVAPLARSRCPEQGPSALHPHLAGSHPGNRATLSPLIRVCDGDLGLGLLCRLPAEHPWESHLSGEPCFLGLGISKSKFPPRLHQPSQL